MRFWTWLAGALNDPTDRQGSTKRLVMFIFLTNFMSLFTGVVIADDWTFPDIPNSVIILVFGVLGAMGFLATVDKGIEMFKAKNAGAVEIAKNVSASPQGTGDVQVNVGEPTKEAQNAIPGTVGTEGK